MSSLMTAARKVQLRNGAFDRACCAYLRAATFFVATLWVELTIGATSPNFDPSCAPFGPNSCASMVSEDWRYMYTNFCAVNGPFDTEQEAADGVREVFQSSCSVDVNPTANWLMQGATSISKCGTRQNFASLPFLDRNTAIETRNFKPYQAISVSGSNCSSTSTHNFYIERFRELACPAPGMTVTYYGSHVIDGLPYSQKYCKGKNEAKDFGAPSCAVGNPINVATGNKYQREIDYISATNSLLRFERHYNSSGHRYAHVYRFGPEWLSALGSHWRHSYDRRIKLVETGSLVTAFVYREDGKIHWYNLYNDQWYTDKDVSSRLERLPTGWRFTNAGDDSVEMYDVNGMIQSITMHNGLSVTLSYGANGLLSTVMDSTGRQLQLSYAADGRLAAMMDPAGTAHQYSYDDNGMLESVAAPAHATRSYLYNETQHVSGANLPHALTGIKHDEVRYATFTYETSGRARSSEHGQGVDLTTVTYPTNTTRTVTDALGTNRTYTITDVLGSRHVSAISQACSSCGTNATATFDVNGNVSSQTEFSGARTCYAHDLARNLGTVRVEGFASGVSCPANLATYTPIAGTRQRKITTQWHTTYRLPTQIDEPRKRTTYTHDANGNVLTRTVLDTTTNESRTWTYTYNSFGQVLTADGPRTDVSDLTTYTYYACTTGYQCGQVETITNALGHTTTYDSYNAHGQPLTITDPNGVVTTLTYDLRQRLTSRTVGSEVTSFEYWPTGLLKKVTMPDGSYLQYTYDAAHRLTDIIDAEGNRIHYTLDAMGNRTAEEAFDPSNALLTTRTRVFNALNQLWKEVGAAGTPSVTTTYGYDNNGNQTTIAAPLGRNSSNGYDELNRLTTLTDPASGVTQYGYNALDQLISVTDPRNKVTQYTYNALDDLKQQVSPDTGTSTSTYDSGGNLKTKTDARNKTGTYVYDALNRVTSLTYPDQTITYVYDAGSNPKGRLTSVTDNSGSTSWTYDAHGRVLSRTQAMSSVSKSLSYAYDQYGRLESLTLPSGNYVSYGYTDGKVTSVTLNGSTTILSNVLYQPFGPTTGWNWGNGTFSAREYDQDGKITDLESAGLRTYSYDDAFRITTIADADDPSLTQAYGYDLLDRLLNASGTTLNQSWTYDANGNRLTQGGSAPSTYSVSTTNNRVNSISGSLTRTYGYDAAGNTTSDGTATFTYDDAGRMVSASKSGATASYSLNALGQRVRKTIAGTHTYSVYGESGHLVGEYDNSGALIQETIWLGDVPIAVLNPNGSGVGAFYIHTDHLNTPRRISRPSDDAIVWRWDSDPFGTTVANEDPDGDSASFVYNLRFPGQYHDAETGLQYNYFRDYDPATGRYVQSDPIGLHGGFNTYAYVKSDPLALADPFGLDSRAEPRPCFVCWPYGDPHTRPPEGWAEEQWWEDLKDGAKNVAKTVKDWCTSADEDIMLAEQETLTAAEEEAIRAKNAGKPYDPAAYNRARQKQIKNEKYAKQRNKRKRGA